MWYVFRVWYINLHVSRSIETKLSWKIFEIIICQTKKDTNKEVCIFLEWEWEFKYDYIFGSHCESAPHILHKLNLDVRMKN
jgi:hypothetical protein